MALNTKITTWSKQRVWIIGASTGIGAALANALHSKGAKVALSARSENKLAEMVTRFGASRAMALPLDITDVKRIKAAEEELLAAWGGYDLIVLMAGDYTPMRAWEIDLKVAKHMIDTNLTGFMNALSVAIPTMMAQRQGGIAIVSSVAGYRGLPNSLVYGPTKAALINLAEAMYMDLKPKGINTYVICPGFVKTPLTDQNEFDMPAIITPGVAADEIIKGFENGEFEIHFPKRFSRMLKALQALPYALYFAAIKRSVKL